LRRVSRALERAYVNQARWLVGLANIHRKRLSLVPLRIVKGGNHGDLERTRTLKGDRPPAVPLV